MAYETTRYGKLYAKLISLYPRHFRERVGESMAQTFNDLCRERRAAKKNVVGFVLWTFMNTIIGIIKEKLHNNMRAKVHLIGIVLTICVLVILSGIWWVNGGEDTWLYVTCGIIAATSFFYLRDPKKEDQ